MKKTIIILILFFAVFSAKAQTIYDVLENQDLNYFQKVEQIETIKDNANKGLTEIDSAILKRYDRYVTFWDSRIDENGSTLSFVNAMKNYTENR